MNIRSNIIDNLDNLSNLLLSNLLKVIGFMAFFTLMTSPVSAQSSLKAARKATGEIVSTSQTTINGFSAISGMTIFGNTRIRTGKQGAAIISLGKLGRIELGAETDMTLRLSGSSIGGELHSNRVVVSARTGTAIAINTAEGIVTTDGRQPAVLTIYADSKGARVVAHLGEASIVSTSKEGGPKEDRMAEGEKLLQASGGVGWRRARLAAGTTSASGSQGAGQVARSVTATATPKASTLAELFKAGINYSIDPKFDRDSDSNEPFETSMTCRDNNDKKHCRYNSCYKPKPKKH